MYSCKVFNVWSNNSAYVVDLGSKKEVEEFVERKEQDEYVDRVEVKKPRFRDIVWRWFQSFSDHVIENVY